MLIANPIYDIVFKYLMEDSRVAKILLSAITNLDIIELDFLPQELSANIEEKDKKEDDKNKIIEALGFSIYRLDFSAKVREKSGEEKVIIIEIQKSKHSNAIMRFRRYLGKQFMNPDLHKWVTNVDKPYKKGIPILSIYFLGEEIETYKNIPIILVDNQVKDRYTNETLDSKNDFVSSLYHTGIIVNIPALIARRRDELEKLLSIFDQDNQTETNHILNVNEEDFPEIHRPIIRRLKSAKESPEIRDIMLIEDDFMNEIADYENRVLAAIRDKEEAKEEAKEAKEVAKEVARKAIEEVLNTLKITVKGLQASGMSLQAIADLLQKSKTEISNLLN